MAKDYVVPATVVKHGVFVLMLLAILNAVAFGSLYFNGAFHVAVRTECVINSFETGWAPDDSSIPVASSMQLPIELRPVAYKVMKNDSGRYGIDDERDWSSLNPKGFGFVRIPVDGSNDETFFTVSMYHQLQCLNVLRRIMKDKMRNATGTDVVHSSLAADCLGYLRQAILCQADTTLELATILTIGDGRVVPGVFDLEQTHQCGDWTQIREYMEERYEIWSLDPLPGNHSSR